MLAALLINTPLWAQGRRASKVKAKGKKLDKPVLSRDFLKKREGIAPILGRNSKDAIKDHFIISFKKGIRDDDARKFFDLKILKDRGNRIDRKFSGKIFQGFAGKLSGKALAILQKHPKVSYIEADQKLKTGAIAWGLDRSDQQGKSMNNSYVPKGSFKGSGTGVHAYILDTGIKSSHSEFGGRVKKHVNFTDDGKNYDCHGHGTHVAGTVGGKKYGMAKNVSLYGLKVLKCNGSGAVSSIIDGLNWVAKNHKKPAVVNMSLGSPASNSFDKAVKKLLDLGITLVAAAGNEDQNACNRSPARVSKALTVGSIAKGDSRSSFSNWGSCVNIFAPGSSISSAGKGSNSEIVIKSGTSMAAPHVAGAVALYLANNKSASSNQVFNALLGTSLASKVKDTKGSPNKLLFVGSSGQQSASSKPKTSTPKSSAAPCSSCQYITGSLTNSEPYNFQPKGSYYKSNSGIHRGWLETKSDYDLYLFKWVDGVWKVAAFAENDGNKESLTYNGGSGYYFWLVKSFKGTGSYKFWLDKP